MPCGAFFVGKHMNKTLAVVFASLVALLGLARPAAITKADMTSTDPVVGAIATIPASQVYRVVQMRVTAYSSSADETDYNPEYTASGLHVRDGLVASNLFPFGTKIKIPALFGDKIFTVEDRMAKRFQKTIDIWMPSKAQALYFGVANAKIIVMGTSTLASYNPPNSAVVLDKDITLNVR